MIWKKIPGFSDYEISEFGDVRKALDYIKPKGVAGRKLPPGAPIKSPTNNKTGYRYLTLKDEKGPRKDMHIHVLVAITFHGPRPSKKHKALHWDDNKSNNHYTNIRWGTDSDNQQDCIRNGNRPLPSNSRFSMEEIREIRKLNKEGLTGNKLAKLYKTDMHTMYDIVKHKTYKDTP